MQQASSFYHDVLAMNLNKSLKLAAADDRKKIVVASDGRLDESKPASIATLTCTKDVRLALITRFRRHCREHGRTGCSL